MEAMSRLHEEDSSSSTAADPNRQHSENYIWSTRDRLGQGTFGTVYRGQHRTSHLEVAVKIFNTSQSDSDWTEDFSKLKNLCSPYIVKYIAEEAVAETQDRALILELADGSMEKELAKPGNRVGISKDIFLQLVDHCVEGLLYLDRHRIAHRDIKPANILIKRAPTLSFKLADFGSYRMLNTPDETMSTNIGTPAYKPEKLLRCWPGYTKDEFDLWSTACTFFECATGRHPFRAAFGSEYVNNMVEMYESRPGNIVCADYDSIIGEPVYHTDLPPQHRSYSSGFREILCAFFRALFSRDKEYLRMGNFFELCKELVSLEPVEYYFLNASTYLEYYSTSVLHHFSRALTASTFEEFVKRKWRDLSQGPRGRLEFLGHSAILPSNLQQVRSDSEKFRPVGQERRLTVALVPQQSDRLTSVAIRVEDLYLVVFYEDDWNVIQVTEKGRQVDITRTEEATIFHVACRKGIESLVTHLLEKGENVNKRAVGARTPLMLAAEGGHSKIVAQLLEHGAHMEDISPEGQTALYYAVCSGSITTVETLVRKGAKIYKDSRGCTPLHAACAAGSSEFVKYFLDRESPIDAKDSSGCTPLLVAVKEKRYDIAAFLVKRAANVNLSDTSGGAPLQYAAGDGNLEFVKLLMRNGARFYSGNSEPVALYEACKNGHADVARYFVDDGYGDAIVPALISGENEVAIMLINAGANVKLTDADGNTPLHLLALHGPFSEGKNRSFRDCSTKRLDIAVSLLNKGAKVDARNKQKETPLICAAQFSEYDLAELLIRRGAKVDATDNRGNSALLLASKYPRLDMVKLLVDNGANVRRKNNREETALHYTAEGGGVRIAEFLLKHGAVINTAPFDEDGGPDQTPLYRAHLRRNQELENFLIDHGAAYEKDRLCAIM